MHFAPCFNLDVVAFLLYSIFDQTASKRTILSLTRFMKANLLVFLILLAGYTYAQQPATALQPGKKLSGKIKPGENHVYNVNMKQNFFAVIHVEQNGIDLIMKTADPEGKELGTFDSPNGTQGPEMVSITSTAAGNYTVTVNPLDPEKPGGEYTIELLRVEPKGATPEKQIDQLMTTIVTPGSAGATIAVGKGDKVLFNKGYGSANLEYDIPNTPGSIFHIASVSKQFTAFAIAMLADQGKLSLDDDIRKHLPELHDFGHKITIRHLIHHTSGLRDQWNLLALAGWRLDDVITREQVLRLMFNQRELNFKPGDEMVYCNTGYTFMAEIVSRVTGKSFPDWCNENIFKPLGMNNTLFYDDHQKIVKNRAYSFVESPTGLKKSVLSYANVGATSLFTTAEDLLKWSRNFKTMKVGNARTMKMMEERAILNKGDTLSYAFGQVLGKHKGLTTWSHGGADAGYRTILLRFPNEDYTFVVLSNLASFNPGKVAYDVADIFLKDLIKSEPVVAKTEKEKPETNAVSVSEELLKKYVGQYELQPGFIVSIRLDQGSMIAQATGQPSIRMVARSENEFFNDQYKVAITFQKDDKGTVNQFTLNQNGQTVVAPRMKEFDPSSVKLNQYTGVYYSPELETRYTLVIENGALVAKQIRHDPITLKPTKENEFESSAWFMRNVVFTTESDGTITGFKASSGRVRNVLFEKQ